ncbi:hypothetical protein TorRG33x02_037740 [Trema orientale]|uniref:Uncharacterized protein n=1 Tax=Trema orientale TaxID=63057 RepID=A0A2P5FRG7_TREOI|nr:hypothetical protein TorRG33x02_037740 [Trema orientale]
MAIQETSEPYTFIKTLGVEDEFEVFKFPQRGIQRLKYHGKPSKILLSHPWGVSAVGVEYGRDGTQARVNEHQVMPEAAEFVDGHLPPEKIDNSRDGKLSVDRSIIFRVRMYKLQNDHLTRICLGV